MNNKFSKQSKNENILALGESQSASSVNNEMSSV